MICFFCEQTHNIGEKGGIYYFDCAGNFCVGKKVYDSLSSIPHPNKKTAVSWLKAHLRYWIVRRKNKQIPIPLKQIETKLKNGAPIPIGQQKRNLLFSLGERHLAEGPVISFSGAPEVSGVFRKEMWHDISFCGSANEDQFKLVCWLLAREGWVNFDPFLPLYHNQSKSQAVQLTEKGENEYLKEVLRRRSNIVFVAMAFGKNRTEEFYRSVLYPTIKKLKLKPFRMDIDNSKAGLIDNAMLYNIQNSKFVIAELSDKNPGAYWEAGYAEGLGIKVIYACEKRQFKNKLHFDVNHRNTILWEATDHQKAKERLQNVIKYCLEE